MMQLLCNGVRLDLYEDAGLQFTHDNPLFAFDKMKCERTTEFALPCTPTNDQVLGLARIAAYKGEGMRRKFDAQLIAGSVVKDGYLYVSSCTKSEYKAVFVTGELIGLQAIKDAGAINTSLRFGANINFGERVYDANEANIPSVAQVRYYQPYTDVHCVPSFSVKTIVETFCAQLGVNINTSNLTDYENVRVVNTGKLSLEEINVPFSLVQENSVPYLAQFLGICETTQNRAALWRATAVDDGGIVWDTDHATLYHESVFSMWKIPYDVTLKFPSDFPSDYYLTQGDLCANPSVARYQDLQFLGGYGFFGHNATDFGTPLAGRSVVIPANTSFMFITKEGYRNAKPSAVGEVGIIGYDAAAISNYELMVAISVDHEWVFGEFVPYNCFLPDCDLVQLLKTIAAINGKVIGYNSTGIVFEDVDLNNMVLLEKDKLTSISQMSRSFNDYMRRNIIEFTSSKEMSVAQMKTAVYTIDNDILEEEQVLQTIPFSEAWMTPEYYTDANGNQIMLEAAVIESEEEYGVDGFSIMRCSEHLDAMLRVDLPLNEGIKRLCEQSTEIEVTLYMTMAEYNAITDNTKLLIRNLEWLWTSRSWQNGEAKFKLAKC